MAQLADAELFEYDLEDRDKLERTAAAVMAEVARRHGELGQATASYKPDLEHGTWDSGSPRACTGSGAPR